MTNIFIVLGFIVATLGILGVLYPPKTQVYVSGKKKEEMDRILKLTPPKGGPVDEELVKLTSLQGPRKIRIPKRVILPVRKEINSALGITPKLEKARPVRWKNTPKRRQGW